jgi:hypothetical protein
MVQIAKGQHRRKRGHRHFCRAVAIPDIVQAGYVPHLPPRRLAAPDYARDTHFTRAPWMPACQKSTNSAFSQLPGF